MLTVGTEADKKKTCSSTADYLGLIRLGQVRLG